MARHGGASQEADKRLSFLSDASYMTMQCNLQWDLTSKQCIDVKIDIVGHGSLNRFYNFSFNCANKGSKLVVMNKDDYLLTIHLLTAQPNL